MFNGEGTKMDYDIEFINTTDSTVDYSERAIAEFERGMGDRIEVYTEQFESDCGLELCDADDIGGLIVYSAEGALRAVYDYENFCGWLV
jgi:hypothetical protein